MKRKYLIVFLVVLALISVFTMSVAAEVFYDDVPNVLLYSDLQAAFLDPYPGSYCVMTEYGTLVFHYADSSLILESNRSYFFSVIDIYNPSIYFASCYGVPMYGFGDDVSLGGILLGTGQGFDVSSYHSLGYSFDSSSGVIDYANQTITLRQPYLAFDDVYYGSEDGSSISWQPFADIADVPTAPPASDVSFFGVLGEMVEILIGGIVPFAGGVGSGLSNLAAAIFLSGTGDELRLSVFGGVIIIFAGVALAIGLSRFVVGWLTSLGASD